MTDTIPENKIGQLTKTICNIKIVESVSDCYSMPSDQFVSYKFWFIVFNTTFYNISVIS